MNINFPSQGKANMCASPLLSLGTEKSMPGVANKSLPGKSLAVEYLFNQPTE